MKIGVAGSVGLDHLMTFSGKFTDSLVAGSLEKVSLSLTVNFDEVCNEIIEKLSMLRDCPNRLENPLIYHLVLLI